MIGVDTNVVARYLLQDDAAQAARANALFAKAASGGEVLYLNHVVVCELLWVLDRAVGLSRAVLAETVERLLTSAQCEFESRDLLWRALTAFRTSKADFADCLIAVKNAAAGCEVTATFDRRAAAVAGFSVL